MDEVGAGGLLAGGLFMMIIQLAIAVLMIAAMWKVFEKAGEPGWAAIVPIYNLVILTKIIDKPVWWLFLFIIPLVNIIPCMELARKFGKSDGFGVGLALLGFIFFPILGFGDAKYQGHSSEPAMATARV